MRADDTGRWILDEDRQIGAGVVAQAVLVRGVVLADESEEDRPRQLVLGVEAGNTSRLTSDSSE